MRISLICFFLLQAVVCFAQINPMLEKKVSLQVSNMPIESILKQISQQTGINFSYSPDVINVSEAKNLNVRNQPVRDVLDMIFNGKVKYKEKGKYIILQKNDNWQAETHIILSGYVVDNATGNKISQASLYEKNTLASAVSNPAGYYQIKLPANRSPWLLSVSKQDYQPVYIPVQSEKAPHLDIRLIPNHIDTLTPLSSRTTVGIQPDTSLKIKALIPEPSPQRELSILEKIAVLSRKTYLPLVNLLTSAEQKIHFSNINDTIQRTIQVSLVPYIGTNHVLSGNTEVDYSFNILAGFTKSVKRGEIGGFANFVRKDVKFLQIAGVLNAVGGNVTGVQAAGFFNHVSGDVDGVQLSGVANHTAGTVFGVQVGSFYNHVWENVYGVQVAGFANTVAGKLDGVQVSGFANIALGEMKGVQVAPIFNLAGKLKRGWQVGLINFADSAGAARQVGLLSFSRKGGYRRLEFSYDELQNVHLTFKTGVPGFYNILTIGTNPFGTEGIYTFGYGLGSSLLMKKGWALDVNLTGIQITRDFRHLFESGILRFGLLAEKKIGKHFALAAGPTANLWISNQQPVYDFPYFYSENPRFTFLDEGNFKAWAGFQIALRVAN